jgi:hypothetical protein
MSLMESSTIRCPHCQKKQPEPCPKRCGCGQSLVALLAVPNRMPAAAGRSEIAGPWRQTPVEPPVEPIDNEW